MVIAPELTCLLHCCHDGFTICYLTLVGAGVNCLVKFEPIFQIGQSKYFLRHFQGKKHQQNHLNLCKGSCTNKTFPTI